MNASTSAFATARAKTSSNKTHFIDADTTVNGDPPHMKVGVLFPLEELALARPGTGQKKSVGFAFEATVDIPGEGRFVLRSAWVSITAR